MKRALLAPLALFVLLGFDDAAAVEPVTRHHARFEDFAEGTGMGVAIDADGDLSLAAALVPLVETESQRIWRLLEVGEALWIATGDDGRIYRLENGGDPVLLLDSPEISIHSLARAHDDGVYAGTSPDGLIYRISVDGSVATLAHTETRYVWDLAIDGRALLVATGAPARVLRVEDGRTETWFESPTDGHVRSLVKSSGHWFAGTSVSASGASSDGVMARIYEVSAKGARLVLETDFEEVTFLAAVGDTLFAAVTTSPPSAEGGDTIEPHSALLRVEPGGAAFPIWQGTGVIAALMGPSQGPADRPPVRPADRLLTAVLRQPGRLLQLQTDGSGFRQLARIDSVIPNSAGLWRGRLIVGDGRSGQLSSFAEAPGDSGWFDARVEDLGAHGDWGAIEWEADVPRGSRVELRTRSGNSREPDDNWSAWSAVLTKSGARIPSPPGRYLQYRVVLRGDGKQGPTIHRVSFTARQTNLPPRIESLTTFAYRGNPQAPGPLPQPANGAGNGQRHLPQSKSLRLVRWDANDPNGDELRFSISLRGAGQRTWKLVEEEIELTSVFWDTEAMPEGMTQLRLVASDAAHNPEAWALQDEYISEPFAIDNSPPVVELTTRKHDDITVVEARFTDRITAVHGASYSIDYADHGPRLAPLDGLFDSRQEGALFRLGDLEAGEHVVSVHAWDQLDNVGVACVVVTVD